MTNMKEAISLAAMRTACCTELPELRLSSDEAQQLAQMFKAIGQPVRLQIVDLLSRFGGKVCVCDIESQFDLTQPTISHHLKALREAGVVDYEMRGLWAYYFVRPAQLQRLRALVGEWIGGHTT